MTEAPWTVLALTSKGVEFLERGADGGPLLIILKFVYAVGLMDVEALYALIDEEEGPQAIKYLLDNSYLTRVPPERVAEIYRNHKQAEKRWGAEMRMEKLERDKEKGKKELEELGF